MELELFSAAVVGMCLRYVVTTSELHTFPPKKLQLLVVKEDCIEILVNVLKRGS